MGALAAGAVSDTSMRRHHEELAAAPSVLPALSMLIPFAGAMWLRIKALGKKHEAQSARDPDCHGGR